MSALSPAMREAYDVAREHGGLAYARGGYWVAPGQEPLGQHWSGDGLEWGWHTTAGTVKALIRRGLLVGKPTTQYPRFDSQAVLPDGQTATGVPVDIPTPLRCEHDDACSGLTFADTAERDRHDQTFHDTAQEGPR